jgi:hypothetical protein
MPKAGFDYGSKIPGPQEGYKQIAQTAEDEVTKALAFVTRPDDLIVRAAEIVRQADAEIGLHIDDRDQALASLWFYERRLGLAKTIGVTATAYREILAKAMFGDPKHPLPDADSPEELTQLARTAGVPRVKDAEDKIIEPSVIVAKARARRGVAVRFMQEAIWALSQSPYDWSPEKIAEHVGVTRKLIYRQRAAAMKRRGL